MLLLQARSVRLSIFMMLVVALVPVGADEGQRASTGLNGGYYLLHHLAKDESNVPMLMMVKHAPRDITQFSDDIGKVAKKSLAALDRFQDNDSSLRVDENPLPAIEQSVRDSIKADKQHQLLFGTSDTEFVRAFLVSQIEATTYAVHLNKVMADQETNPARAKTLRNLSNDWGLTRARAYRLLRNY